MDADEGATNGEVIDISSARREVTRSVAFEITSGSGPSVVMGPHNAERVVPITVDAEHAAQLSAILRQLESSESITTGRHVTLQANDEPGRIERSNRSPISDSGKRGPRLHPSSTFDKTMRP